MGLMRADKSMLLVVDVQESLMRVGHEAERTVERITILARAALALGIPIVACEQYPRGLGPTVTAVREAIGDAPVLAKTQFSGLRDPGIADIIEGHRAAGRHQVIVCGVEAHVCVLQSAMDAHDNGAQVFVVADACTSRRPSDVELAMRRMRATGVSIVSSEMVVFEWLEKAGTAAFKTVSALVK
jgi:nicotinamidase-related amidase